MSWQNIMKILNDLTNQDDLELILYSMILINTVLNSIPDQDTFYDVSDALEEQGIQRIIQHYMKNPLNDDMGYFKQIVQQMELYEAALKQEDGDDLDGSFVDLSYSSNGNLSANQASNLRYLTTNKMQFSRVEFSPLVLFCLFFC